MTVAFNARELSALIKGDAVEFIRDLGGDLLSTLVLATPVGNPALWQNPNSAPPGYVGGHARRNWQVGLGTAPSGELPGEDQGGTSTISSGQFTIKQFRTVGQPVFIANNAPYIGRLNDGHSTQAPRLFVERSIARVVRTAKLRNRR